MQDLEKVFSFCNTMQMCHYQREVENVLYQKREKNQQNRDMGYM